MYNTTLYLYHIYVYFLNGYCDYNSILTILLPDQKTASCNRITASYNRITAS